MNNSFKKSAVIDELAGKISPFFSIYDVQEQEGSIYFFGVPKDDIRNIYPKLWAVFLEKGYQFSFKYELGEQVLVASPFKPPPERIWINAVLAFATFVTTMVMGSLMFGANPVSNPFEVLKGLPFTIAIMAVLGAHETGHYIVAKKHGMHTSLPYFIPFPSFIGTMGAIIRHRGPIPNRKALFDVGVSGPLIGLAVSIIVTIIGLLQPPLQQTTGGVEIQLSLPPLFELITRVIPDNQVATMHPIAFAGWVGMLVTALNLIPVGQLDGGHVLRAMMGEKAAGASWIMAVGLFILGFYMTSILNMDGSIWVFWGLLLVFFAGSGHPRPVNDEIPLDKGRMVLGVVTFMLGLLCVTPVPFAIK